MAMKLATYAAWMTDWTVARVNVQTHRRDHNDIESTELQRNAPCPCHPAGTLPRRTADELVVDGSGNDCAEDLAAAAATMDDLSITDCA